MVPGVRSLTLGAPDLLAFRTGTHAGHTAGRPTLTEARMATAVAKVMEQCQRGRYNPGQHDQRHGDRAVFARWMPGGG
jgi:hypothetical protein